jgi:hypothetical protein
MNSKRHTIRSGALAVAAAGLILPALGLAQGPPVQHAPQTAREAAPVDLTGTWVSVISEEWRWRMVTPLPGDFANIPLNAEGRRVGLQWDPDADTAADCKAYGAPALMRIPGRVRIAWQDDQTLRIEADQGRQTRLLRFGGPIEADGPPSRQGESVANWERPARGMTGSDALGIFSNRVGRDPRSLEVTTTNLLPGYLRKNGAPHSGTAVVREFYDYHSQPNGDEWFTVTTVVEDPRYLSGPYITSSDFKKEPDDGDFDPTPCTAR